MQMHYILYNPTAGNGSGKDIAECMQVIYDDTKLVDITRITNYRAFLRDLHKEDILVIVGGDGTLNRFVNDTDGIEIAQQILYYPSGSGNDFAKDLGKSGCGNPFEISRYLQNLPSVEINGKHYLFLNGVGFGLDGYCCQAGNKVKQTPGKKVNYPAIAVKGLLCYFEPRNAKITVDRTMYAYQKVWIAPTMHGRYYGSGMLATPDQDRLSENLSLMVFHGAGRLRTLCVFPSIFKGKHIQHKSMVSVHTGKEITVEFDRPTPLQIDGETIMNVTRYTARAAQ